MSDLLNLKDLLAYFKIKDKRTLYKLLSELEVPLVSFGGKLIYAKRSILEKAVKNRFGEL